MVGITPVSGKYGNNMATTKPFLRLFLHLRLLPSFWSLACLTFQVVLMKFIKGGLAEVLHGLCQLGYRFDVEILSAAAVGAPHLRERILVVAHASSLCGQAPPWSDQVRSQITAVTVLNGIAGIRASEGNQTILAPWRSLEPPICGVAHGLSRRLDRLAAISEALCLSAGNAVVPAVAAIAIQRVLYLESHRP
jgi:DNA (cytosine-5)-methyltransferase 1